jgi:glycine cleavage system H protein
MADFPDNLQYTKDHEWICVTGDEGVIGITDFAQAALGDVVYVELPRVGDKFEKSDPFGSVESVKSVSELFIPVSGEILEINEAIADAPESVNNEPYKAGWMIKVKIAKAGELDSLLSSSEYEDFCKAQGE